MLMYTLDALTKVKAQTVGLPLSSLSSSVEQEDDIADSLDYLNRTEFPAVLCPTAPGTEYKCDVTPKLLSTTFVAADFTNSEQLPIPPVPITDFLASNDKEGFIEFNWTQSVNSTSESLWIQKYGVWTKIDENVSSPAVYEMEAGLPYTYVVLSVNEFGSTRSNVNDGQAVVPVDTLVLLTASKTYDTSDGSFVTSGTRATSNTNPFEIFNSTSDSYYWATDDNVGADFVTYDFLTDEEQVITLYTIQCDTVAESPTHWTLEVAVGNGPWEVIHTVVAAPWTGDYSHLSFPLTTLLPCTKVRLQVTEASSTQFSIQNLELKGVRKTSDNPLKSILPPLPTSGAKGQVTSSSETKDPYGAFTHWLNSWWASKDDALEEWIAVQLIDPTVVTKYSHANVDSSSYVMNSWRFEGSHDGVVYEILDDRSDGSEGNYDIFEARIYDIPNTEAFLFYRIVVLNNNSEDGLTPYLVGDIQLYGPTYTALGPVISTTSNSGSPEVTTSSELPGNEGWNAFTSDVSSTWVSADNPTNEHITYSFASPTLVSGIGIRGIQDPLHYLSTVKDYTVECSEDGITWNILSTIERSQALYPAELSILEIPTVQTSHIRIRITANIDTGVVRGFGISQIILYGEERVTYPLIPRMFANDIPYGYASATDSYGASSPYEAFNGKRTESGDMWSTDADVVTSALKYRFKDTVEVNSYRLYKSSASTSYGVLPKAWRVEVSHDAITWETVHTAQDTPLILNRWLEFTVDAVITGNYIRIVLEEHQDGHTRHSIDSFEVMGTIVSPTLRGAPGFSLLPALPSNVSAYGTASASSELSTSYEAWRAFDGYPRSHWVSRDNATEEWLQFEFDTSTTISAYTLQARESYVLQGGTTWEFLGSDDGITFDILDTRNAESWEISDFTTYSLGAPVTYKFYRLHIMTGQDRYLTSPFAVAQLLFHGETATRGLIKNRTTIGPNTCCGDLTCSADAEAPYEPGRIITTNKYNECFLPYFEPIWFNYEFGRGVATTATYYSIMLSLSYYDGRPLSWELQGSNDGILFDTLDTQIEYAWTAVGESVLLPVATTGSYTIYRLLVNSVSDDYLSFSRWQLYDN